MMKKLLALLLTVTMLLPAVACADAVTTRYEIQLGLEPYRALLTEVFTQNGEEIEPEILNAVTEFICGVLEVAAVEVTTQDNGLELAILLQDERLFSAAATFDGAELLISTSLLKDRVFVVNVTEAAADIATIDWEALTSELELTVKDWYVSRELNYEPIGNFAGTAYDDGDERIVIRIDDMDVALLVEGLLLNVEKSGLLPVLNDAFGADNVSGALRMIREFNYDAALDNSFEYEIAVVYRQKDLSNEFAGASVNVTRDGELAWSLSVGQKDGNIKLIAAFHVGDKTNYFALTQANEAPSSKELTTTTIFAIYQSEAGATYAEASADPAKALVYIENVMNGVVAGTQAHYRKDANGVTRSVVDGVENPEMRYSETEEYAKSPFTYKKSAGMYFGESEEAISQYWITKSPAEMIVHPADAERINVEALAEDDELLYDIADVIMTDGLNEMGVIAFRNIPAEVLVILLKLMQ